MQKQATNTCDYLCMKHNTIEPPQIVPSAILKIQSGQLKHGCWYSNLFLFSLL